MQQSSWFCTWKESIPNVFQALLSKHIIWYSNTHDVPYSVVETSLHNISSLTFFWTLRVVPLFTSSCRWIRIRKWYKVYWFIYSIEKDCIVNCKTWDGRLIHTLSCFDDKYIICETIPDNENKKTKKFKLNIEKMMLKLSWKLAVWVTR